MIQPVKAFEYMPLAISQAVVHIQSPSHLDREVILTVSSIRYHPLAKLGASKGRILLTPRKSVNRSISRVMRSIDCGKMKAKLRGSAMMDNSPVTDREKGLISAFSSVVPYFR